jgi:hypothetical protein
MKALETVGKWAVIGGALVWVVGKLGVGPVRQYEGVAGMAVLLGAGAFILGWLL